MLDVTPSTEWFCYSPFICLLSLGQAWRGSDFWLSVSSIVPAYFSKRHKLSIQKSKETPCSFTKLSQTLPPGGKKRKEEEWKNPLLSSQQPKVPFQSELRSGSEGVMAFQQMSGQCSPEPPLLQRLWLEAPPPQPLSVRPPTGDGFVWEKDSNRVLFPSAWAYSWVFPPKQPCWKGSFLTFDDRP